MCIPKRRAASKSVVPSETATARPLIVSSTMGMSFCSAKLLMFSLQLLPSP